MPEIRKSKPSRQRATTPASRSKKLLVKKITPPKQPAKPLKTKPRRTRRTTEEVIYRIIAAATEEFESRGYSGTKTAAIAKRAEVAEALIFVHFGTKSKLFSDAISKPLSRHAVEFAATHLGDGKTPVLRSNDSKEYIKELAGFIQLHARMMLTLAVAHSYPSEGEREISHSDGVNEYLARAVELGQQHARPESKIGFELMARLSFAALLSPIIFRKWLFPEGLVSDDELLAAITEFVHAGLQV